MTDQAAEMTLFLEGDAEDDSADMERLTRQLRSELLNLDVEDVEFVSGGEAPAQTKAGDPVTWGQLVLTLAASGGVFVTLIGAVQNWLSRHERRSLVLEMDGDRLEIQGISSTEQQRLIDAWLSRHKGFVTPND